MTWLDHAIQHYSTYHICPALSNIKQKYMLLHTSNKKHQKAHIYRKIKWWNIFEHLKNKFIRQHVFTHRRLGFRVNDEKKQQEKKNSCWSHNGFFHSSASYKNVFSLFSSFAQNCCYWWTKRYFTVKKQLWIQTERQLLSLLGSNVTDSLISLLYTADATNQSLACLVNVDTHKHAHTVQTPDRISWLIMYWNVT